MNFLNIFQFTIIFLLGISFGSFLGVVIDRFATNRSIIRGRSYCESCKKTLSIRDLIPLLSYLLLKGKCRFCKKKIPTKLFVVELFTGLLFLSLYPLYGGFHISIIITFYILALIFTAIFFTDLFYGIIPDKLTIVLTVVVFIYVMISGQNIYNHLLAGLGSLIFFVGLFLVTRGRGMGLGDVKLSFALGLLLGYPLIVYGLYLAFLTGAIISIILVIWRKKSFRKGTVPFGPFLVASVFFTLLFGENIIRPIARLFF